MRILAVDTSTPYTFVADVSYNNSWSILKFLTVKADRQHDNWLETLLLDFAGIDGINRYDGFAAGSGPGSFTGLRIGFTYLKTIALLWNKIFTVFSTPVLLASLYCKDRETLLVQLNTNLYYSCDPHFLDSGEKIHLLEKWQELYLNPHTHENRVDKIWLWNLYGEKPEIGGKFAALNPETKSSEENVVINLTHPRILTENKKQNFASLPDYGHDVIAKRKL